jgi:PGF-pre-PGF domain-containing protein
MNFKIFITVLSVFVLIPTAFAATLSVTIGDYDTEVYKGAQITIPVEVQLQQSSGTTSVSVTIIPKDGVSCDTCTKTITFTSDGSQSTSFILKGDTVGTYQNPFTITATATGASATSTASNALIVLESPNMQINFYNTSSPVKISDNLWTIPAKMEITTFDVPFEDVVVNISELLSAHDMQIASGPQMYYVGSIPAYSTVTLTWVFNVTGFSVYGVSGTVITDKGSFYPSFTDTYTTGVTETSISPAGGGGGGGGAAEGNVISISSISIGVPVVFDFTKFADIISDIVVTAKDIAYNVKISVQSLAAKPYASMPDPPGQPYKYLKITVTNLPASKLDKAEIKFRIEKSWLKENNVNPATVVLLRNVQNSWESLDTSETSRDATYIYFKAITPGFSYFAITGEKDSGYVEEEAPAPTEAPVPTETPAPTKAPAPTETPAPTAPPTEAPVPTVSPLPTAMPVSPEGGIGTGIIAAAVIIVIAIAAVLVIKREELFGK